MTTLDEPDAEQPLRIESGAIIGGRAGMLTLGPELMKSASAMPLLVEAFKRFPARITAATCSSKSGQRP